MLAVSSLTSVVNEREFSMEDEVEFEEFTGGNLLDSIDFDDIFVGIQVLPDLETYQDFLADYQHDENTSSPAPESVSVSGSGSGSEVGFGSEEESGKSRKSSKKPPGGKKKKKPKVDWTAELHRRFVQAVEQLGLEKAVPSRILEIMGVHTLTRHNIASHLQKYRSHRKHLVAREAEAAHWSQRQQQVKPWIAPTMAFPPPPMPHLIRPLHVWGHPSVDQSMMAIWPKHVAPWQPPPPPFWHPHHQYVPTTGTPCFPPQLPPMRAAMYKVEPGAAPQTVLTKAPSDVHPTKESIDAAIGEVIAKPWLPLPLGLKPPSMDSVMTQLQRQGVSNIPQS